MKKIFLLLSLFLISIVGNAGSSTQKIKNFNRYTNDAAFPIPGTIDTQFVQDNTTKQLFYWDSTSQSYQSFYSTTSLSGPDLVYRPVPLSIYSKETILTNFQASHGFVKGGQGTQSDDTVDFIKGSQSLKYVTNGLGNASFAGRSITAIDLSASYFKVWVKVDDPTKVAELWFYAADIADFSKRYTWKLEEDISQIKANTWVQLTLSWGKATVTSTPNRSAITDIRVRVTDKNTGAVTVNFGGWSYFTEPTLGVLSIMFDDGWLSVFTVAKPIMDLYGFKGTVYIIPDKVGTTGYMTLAQIKILQEQGWCVASHHSDDLSALTTSEVETRIRSVKSYLTTNSFYGVDNLALPMGRYNETVVMPLCRKYFRTTRTISEYSESNPPADPFKLRLAKNIIDTTTTAAVAAIVDRVRVNKEVGSLLWHKIVTSSPVAETEYLNTNFATIMADIFSDGVLVKTVCEIY